MRLYHSLFYNDSLSYFNPRTPYGMRPKDPWQVAYDQTDFNPRTPYGMRQKWVRKHDTRRKFQSTHPLRDATMKYPDSNLLVINFNPRTPYGMRLRKWKTGSEKKQFQSTHPLRDATDIESAKGHEVLNFNPRTPYGMRLDQMTELEILKEFQSTHPLRDATVLLKVLFMRIGEFQSTHPLRDATFDHPLYAVSGFISIHAPLTGCDLTIWWMQCDMH